ncbi:MAG: alpha/beta hydrolase [Planctomycetaceae bacterium]
MTARLALLLAVALGAAFAREQGRPSTERRAADNARQRYFLIGPEEGVAAPKKGFGLLVVLPGGDGSAEFAPFVKRIVEETLDKEWIAAQPVAVRWTEEQQIVWPTAKVRAEKMEFTTEEFVEAVIADVKALHAVDASRLFLLAWSSSGPAAYSLSLLPKKSPTGFYIAMSVFRPDTLPDLDEAKGEAYFIDHSPDDRVCPFSMAQDAEKRLAKKGAKVKLVTYAGGHGWQGDLYGRLRQGWSWLTEHRSRPARS